ncbi:hypothetical protein B9G55_17150 [Saccharibacillus sp. O16]|nr:hypothetical protein B9G55_17150 [Saccharibacillus sp. O16]
MAITIWLVRHGLKEKEIGDVGLTLEGIQQAKSAAQALSSRPITLILSSPLRRAKETAEYLAQALQLNVHEDRRLRERANWGDLPGQTFEEFVEVWERCTRDSDHQPPGGGDSARQAALRLHEAVRDYAPRCRPGEELVFFTHGGVMTDYLVCTLEEAELNKTHPNFMALQSSLVPECSITELIVQTDGRCRLGRFADVRHLEA